MKSKKTTYLLICCVAGVWGIIFYRVFAASWAEDETPVINHNVREPFFNMIDHANDHVELDMAYSDPFATGYAEPEKISDVPVQVTPIQSMPVKPKVNWMGITYNGQIYNPVEKRHIAIISINGKEVMLSEGEKANGLKFIKRIGDSIKVEYQDAVKYLSLIK